jgi:hypothetical protein
MAALILGFLLSGAIVVGKLLPHHNAAVTLVFATAAWLIISTPGWWLQRKA